MTKGKILIIEDDSQINHLLSDFLGENGYEIVSAFEGNSASLLMRENDYDIILMDLMLPNKSGDDLIKELREYSNVPVIVISAKSMLETRLLVLKMGADDYILKPFDLEEVLVRIEVVLRRSGEGHNIDSNTEGGTENSTGSVSNISESINKGIKNGKNENKDASVFKKKNSDSNNKNVLSCGELYFFSDENRVVFKDKNISLTFKELQILETLMRYPKKTFTKANLYEAVWNDVYYYEDNTINVHVSNLRSKLKKVTGKDYIETVWGIGYRLKSDEGKKDSSEQTYR